MHTHSIAHVYQFHHCTPGEIRTHALTDLSRLSLPLDYEGIFSYQAPHQGFEPSIPYGQRILGASCIPFHHTGMDCLFDNLSINSVVREGIEPP